MQIVVNVFLTDCISSHPHQKHSWRKLLYIYLYSHKPSIHWYRENINNIILYKYTNVTKVKMKVG